MGCEGCNTDRHHARITITNPPLSGWRVPPRHLPPALGHNTHTMAKKDKEAEVVAEDAAPVAPAPKATNDYGFEVGNPTELVPVERPLVIKPGKGKEWANEAQAEFARVLNGYAYKNAAKWEKKKGVLLKQLADLEKNPEAINTLNGNRDLLNVEFKNTAVTL